MTTNRIAGIRACVFDAYGTLFDFNSAARQAQDALGPKWAALSDAWRTKQLQYTWLRSLMGRHADFWQVTGDALDWAMASLEMRDGALRERLMNLYLSLDAYPEVADMLSTLRESGRKLAILSNGAPAMLASAVSNAKLERTLDAVISVEEVGVYKPDPRVYRLAVTHLGLDAREICFVSSNAWDAYAAKAFGMHVIWCNRFKQAAERLPDPPDTQIMRLSELPALLV
jgi:2-haloacid dehalogenase